MKNRVQLYRLEKNITQTQLADKSGLSLRTIQRIEAGTIPKGFTLQSIALALEIAPEELTKDIKENIDLNRVKIINLSALSFLIIPFGNIILPAILTYRTKDKRVKSFGKDIISIQIVWSIITSVLLIISPFIQNAFAFKTPIFMVVLTVLLFLNIFLILKNAVSITRNSILYIRIKNSLL